MLLSNPSDLFAFFDVSRFSELLVDGEETVPGNSDLDSNSRATQIVRSAEQKLCSAVRVKNFYSLQQLRDLVYDFQNGGTSGEQIIEIIADLAWCGATKRKRWPAGTPQGDDPACERAEAYLDRIRAGERIFVLEGVTQHDSTGVVLGVYGQEIPEDGLMEGRGLVSDIGNPSHLWGNRANCATLPGNCGDGLGSTGGWQ